MAIIGNIPYFQTIPNISHLSRNLWHPVPDPGLDCYLSAVCARWTVACEVWVASLDQHPQGTSNYDQLCKSQHIAPHRTTFYCKQFLKQFLSSAPTVVELEGSIQCNGPGEVVFLRPKLSGRHWSHIWSWFNRFWCPQFNILWRPNDQFNW